MQVLHGVVEFVQARKSRLAVSHGDAFSHGVAAAYAHGHTAVSVHRARLLQDICASGPAGAPHVRPPQKGPQGGGGGACVGVAVPAANAVCMWRRLPRTGFMLDLFVFMQSYGVDDDGFRLLDSRVRDDDVILHAVRLRSIHVCSVRFSQ